MELVDSAICSTDLGQSMCDSAGLPYLGEICAQASTYPDRIAEYVPDVESLCGYYDESGTYVQYQIHPICEAWDAACTNGVPSITQLCENIYDAPEALFTAFEAAGESVYDFCYAAQDFEDFNVEDFCEGDFSDVCVNGYPDFVKVCDTDFPPGTFDGSNYYQVCELDIEDVCNTYPEICDTEAGTITSDLCGANPDWCDTSSESYNQCAANLYDCMMDPDFNMCYSFPELCGYETFDEESISMPELRA